MCKRLWLVAKTLELCYALTTVPALTQVTICWSHTERCDNVSQAALRTELPQRYFTAPTTRKSGSTVPEILAGAAEANFQGDASEDHKLLQKASSQ